MRGERTGPIVVMTGDDARKNTFGGLAGVAAATADDETRDVVVIGMAGTGDRVHHWSIAAAMRPGEARTAERISDEEMDALLASASVVVVPSFDEGLSLPVIEALRAGAPVVASDIPAHRELIGTGSFLADPRSPASLAKAVRATAGKSGVRDRQLQRLKAHEHADLETVVAERVTANLRTSAVDVPAPSVFVGGRSLSVGVGAPWMPQRSGVADFTTATIVELARLCDVTVYTTEGADVAGTIPAGVRIGHGRIDDVLANGSTHDAFVSVVGNSHFHLPFIEVVDTVDSVVITHDTRLVELYLSLRGRGGVEQIMLRGKGRRRPCPTPGRADRRHAASGEHGVLGGGTASADAHRSHAHRAGVHDGRHRSAAGAPPLRELPPSGGGRHHGRPCGSTREADWDSTTARCTSVRSASSICAPSCPMS